MFTLSPAQLPSQVWTCICYDGRRNFSPEFSHPLHTHTRSHTHTHTHTHGKTQNSHTQRGYPFLYSTDTAHDQNKLWLENRMAGRHLGLSPCTLSFSLHFLFVCVSEWEQGRVVALGACATTEEASRKSEPIVFLVHWVHNSLCLHNNDQRLLWTLCCWKKQWCVCVCVCVCACVRVHSCVCVYVIQA